MKVCCIRDDYCKIFINKNKVDEFNFSDEKDLELFLKDMLLSLKNSYGLSFNGSYTIDFFINDKLGAFIDICKNDTFTHYRDIDLKLRIVFDCKFYFKTSIYEILKEEKNVYLYDEYYYINVDNIDNIDNIISYIEFGEILYNDELDIENFGIKIT